jgi:pyruvate/2-oxoglutarate dehydrogenase complex dihydrolipoamide dehydrogenase (E3) component
VSLERRAHPANAGGLYYGNGATGSARIVVDGDREVIVGATITGPEIADFLHAATIALVARYRSSAYGMRCPPSRRAASCGSTSWRRGRAIPGRAQAAT